MEMESSIPVTASLPGGPNLRRMIVSASQIHRVITSKDLDKLAKQMLKQRTRGWEKRQLQAAFPPPSPLPFLDSQLSPEAATLTPPSQSLEEPAQEEYLQPPPLKFSRRGDTYKVIQESGEATELVKTLGWEEEADTSSALQEDVEDTDEPAREEVPTFSSSCVAAADKIDQEIQFLPVDNPKPVQLDLSHITPRPVYLPEEQPSHLQRGVVKLQEKTALLRYQEEQEDVQEVKKGHMLKDPEEIICGTPDGQVALKDSTKGLIEIKSPKSPSLMLHEAVRNKNIKFLTEAAATEASGQQKYQLKRKDKYYHQVQALIYAGKEQQFKFCDFVVCLADDTFIERINPDLNWQKEYIPKVRQFCEIYNTLLKEGEQQEEAA